MKPLFRKSKYYAVFYDSVGQYVKTMNLDPTNELFTYKTGDYLFFPNHSSKHRVNGLLRPKIYFFYNVGVPTPIIQRRVGSPYISSSVLKGVVDNKFMKDLESLSGFDIGAFLKEPKNWLIIAGAIGIFIWINSGASSV